MNIFNRIGWTLVLIPVAIVKIVVLMIVFAGMGILAAVNEARVDLGNVWKPGRGL